MVTISNRLLLFEKRENKATDILNIEYLIIFDFIVNSSQVSIGGRFFCARTRVRIFFCGRKIFFRGREFARTLLERKIKNVRAQLGTQIIFVRSRAANVLDMPSVSESPETGHKS